MTTSRKPDSTSVSYAVRWFGAVGLSATIEATGLHPLDTLTKRLINNPKPIYTPGLSVSVNASNLHSALFVDASGKGAFACASSTLRGLEVTLPYRIFQRGFLAGQAPLKAAMEQHFQTKSLWIDLASGIPIGIAETCALMPLDLLRTRAQTLAREQKTLSNRPSFFTGLAPGVLRNISFFSTSSVVTTLTERTLIEKGLLGPCAQNAEAKPSEQQKHVSRAAGFAFAIGASSPLDVTKIRMQTVCAQPNQTAAPPSATQVALKIINQEGFTALYKGVVPKVFIHSLRLTFFLGVADKALKVMLPEEPVAAEKQKFSR